MELGHIEMASLKCVCDSPSCKDKAGFQIGAELSDWSIFKTILNHLKIILGWKL